MSTVYTVNGKVLKNAANDKWLTKKEAPVDPYNPLGLPPNTIRVRTSDRNAPTKGSNTTYETATLVPGTNDTYDVYKSGTSFKRLLSGSSNVIEVLGANTTGITDMNSMYSVCSITSVQLFDTSSVTDASSMFYYCDRLTSVPVFNTSSVTNMSNMFYGCGELTSIPLFDTTKVTKSASMFNNCTKVNSGALALYQQMSTQTTPPGSHYNTFKNCGSGTTTGAAELAQIPSSWGGTGA